MEVEVEVEVEGNDLRGLVCGEGQPLGSEDWGLERDRPAFRASVESHSGK